MCAKSGAGKTCAAFFCDIISRMEKFIDIHAKEKDEILQILDFHIERGITQKEAQKRKEKFGPNIPVKKKDKTDLDILLKQFKNPLVLILLGATFLSAAFSSLADAAIVFLALFVNIAIGFLQEKKADKIFESLSKQLEEKVTVIRDGVKISVDASDLVPGDVMLIEAGKKISADARILDSQNLKLDESALTGESVAQEKFDCVCEAGTPLHKRKNIVYAGTLVVDGLGKAVVFATGENTEFGKIAKETDMSEDTNTPIQKKVAKLSKIIAFAMLGISAVIVVLAFMQGVPASELLLLVIALAVASVPEGLPAAIAVALAVGMERILKHGGLVKYPAAAEALGSVDFILTDKTGTLTSGNMTLEKTIPFRCVEEGCKDSRDNIEVLKAAVLASDAFLEEKDGKLQVHGRPIERAIIEAGIKNNLRQDELFASAYSRLDFIPFSSARRFAISLNSDPKQGQFAYLSGAPESLLDLSDYVLINGESVKFDENQKKEFVKIQSDLSLQGKRLTAVARAHVDSLDFFKENKSAKVPTTFLGFLSFEDEVRDSAIKAVKEAQKMGTEVIMLTGDNKDTAFAIAKRTDIAQNKFQVILGSDFENLNEKEILNLLNKSNKPLRVFSRMLPDQKKRLVSVLQKAGYSVAMTGDGINDAPALALANIGIAVESGTDVAKAAADMILLKSSFVSISFAIKEGRRVLGNIYKIIVYLLSTSVSETILIGTALAFGGPLPLLPSQLLWHNLIEGGLMNFPFAFDKEIKNTGALAKNKKEFERKNYIFAAYLAVLFSSLLLGLYAYMLYENFNIDSIRTVLFVTFSTSGFFLALSLRNIFKPVWLSNPFANNYLNIALAVNMLLLVLAFTFEPLRELLGLKVPGRLELMLILFVALVKWIGIELIKFFIFILPDGFLKRTSK